MTTKLLPSRIDSLAARPERYDVHDSLEKGLTLRVYPSGEKVFRFRQRGTDDAKGRVVTIGPYSPTIKFGCVTLSQARRRVEELKDARRAGKADFVETALKIARERRPEPITAGQTVDSIALEFWKVLDVQRKRGSKDAKEVYDGYIRAAIGHLALKDVKRSRCVAICVASKTRVAKVLGTLKQLLDFAERRFADDDFTNPAARLKASDFGARNKKRQRWLDEKEIAAFWHALEPDPDGIPETVLERRKMAAALRLLLLTGVRTGELRQARWSSVDLEAKTFTVPVALQKLTLKQADEATDFVLSITPTALSLFEELKELADGSPWVLASVTSKAGIYDDKSIGRFMRRLWKGEKASHGRNAAKGHPALAKLEVASPHDLRRTCRSWLGKLGVAPHICERVLNHRLGRIVETYDRHDYFDERRAALELWDQQVRSLITSTSRDST